MIETCISDFSFVVIFCFSYKLFSVIETLGETVTSGAQVKAQQRQLLFLTKGQLNVISRLVQSLSYYLFPIQCPKIPSPPLTHPPQILRKMLRMSNKKQNSLTFSFSSCRLHHHCSPVGGKGSVKLLAEKQVPWLGLSDWIRFRDRVDPGNFWIMSWHIHLVTYPETKQI